MLPSAERQNWLLAEIRDLCGRVGAGPYLANTILLPTPDHFPDVWVGDVDSCRRIALRLLRLAGLARLKARVTGFRELIDPNLLPGDGASQHKGTAAWFA